MPIVESFEFTPFILLLCLYLECEDTFAAEMISCYDDYLYHEDHRFDLVEGVNSDALSDKRSNDLRNVTRTVSDKEKSRKITLANDKGQHGIFKNKRKFTKERVKQMKIQFDKFFNDNKHLFDLNCDYCSKVFESYEDARIHYVSEHQKTTGYIKCCTSKLRCRREIERHIEHRHLNPDHLK